LGLKLPAGFGIEATRNSFEMSLREGDRPKYAITQDGRLTRHIERPKK
jgi:hypothetical protein